MEYERERLGSLQGSEFIIVGDGEIGDKARQLIDKSPTLIQIGFRVPSRTVLAEGFFDEFFIRNGLGSSLRDVSVNDGMPAQITKGSFTEKQFQTISQIAKQFGNNPIIVRSSAFGDARGTGTYLSDVSINHPGQVRKSVQRVLASYFTESAQSFRRDAKTGEGFGIIIEPLIGQDIGGEYAPIFSGFGYTSTARGEGYINIVPGIGGGVDTRDGENITASSIGEYLGELSEYLYSEREAMVVGQKAKRKSALIDGIRLSRGFLGKAFFSSARYVKCGLYKIPLYIEDEFGYAFDDLDLRPFFGMMDQVEQAFDKPQYFEWAMTFDKKQPVYWITQISDVDKKLDIMDFEQFGQIMFQGHTVTGTGVKECTTIANCWNPDDISALYRFNQEYQDYILLFSSRLTSAGGSWRKLSYSDFSNASVFLEIQDAQHLGNPVAHLEGQLDITDKLFAVLDYHADIPPDWDLFHEGETDQDGITVYNGRLKVVASEKQNRLIVYATEEQI